MRGQLAQNELISAMGTVIQRSIVKEVKDARFFSLLADETTDVLDAMAVSEKLGTYPVITALLQIFATMPVTTATGERSFSALKLIKTFLRSTMSEHRLNGLSHLYINKDLELNHDHVIDEFGRNSRRLVFI